jgi:hypothetical protein
MNQVKEQFSTLQEYLELLRRWKAEDKSQDFHVFERTLKRLELIKHHVPLWMKLSSKHSIVKAIHDLDALDFGTVIGRAMVVQTEEEFSPIEDIEALWLIATIGLSPNRRIGRPEAVGTLTQLFIYFEWTQGNKTQQELATEYEISVPTVERIIRRWKPHANL